MQVNSCLASIKVSIFVYPNHPLFALSLLFFLLLIQFQPSFVDNGNL